MFSSDDEMFTNDDDLFGDDGIEAVDDVKPKSDLSKGVLFDNGSIKIGGNFSTSLSTMTTLYSEENKSFADNLKDTKLTPTASALLSVDARPTQELRMYTKFGVAYPTKTLVNGFLIPNNTWFTLKELFTDFSIADRIFFRFGLHTVSWGTGLFFSPVSDLINTSSINPEDTSAQVEGSLNLRTQITFPDSQNCLWLYVIPSTNFTNQTTAESYARDTALAGKYELVLGGWELGLGAFWKYETAPKEMITLTGSLKNLSLFGEFVYSYGAKSEWNTNKNWDNKTSIFQASVGLTRYWKEPSITFAAQYYYDGNSIDKYSEETIPGTGLFISIPSFTKGHNVAVALNFGRIFGTKDLTASLFAMANFGKDKIDEQTKSNIATYQQSASAANLSSFAQPVSDVSMIVSAMLTYSPVSAFSVGMGPYLTWASYDKNPTVSLKLTLKLGGGKF